LYDRGDEEKATKAVAYLERMKVLDFEGGVPTSLVRSGEQWDLG
jgi:hypothetical protein